MNLIVACDSESNFFKRKTVMACNLCNAALWHLFTRFTLASGTFGSLAA